MVLRTTASATGFLMTLWERGETALGEGGGGIAVKVGGAAQDAVEGMRK